ncbi:MAG: ATP-binding protein [Clostridiaceae bacterium]|nr:ATP-binding protein [Clostridiaceae bacterium]
MQELSLNILDIAENSTRAGARLVKIDVIEDPEGDLLTIRIGDDGCGMDPQLLRTVRDPFTTTRTTRKVGLGIPFFEEAAKATGGHLSIRSATGVGTEVEAVFGYSHIDRMPLGDLAATVSILIQGHEDTEFVYTHVFRGHTFCLDTRQLREVLGNVPLAAPDVVLWIRDYINENLKKIYMEGNAK